MPQEDLRSLPPEERIRKLKELEKKRKKEIAEAQEKIRESEEEIKDRLKWLDKVPMPEFAQEDLEGLSEEARQVLKERKGIKEKKKDARRESAEREEVEETEGIEEVEEVKGVKREAGRAGKAGRGGEISLEEALARERAELPLEARAVEYGIHLASQRPMRDIYQELASIRGEAEERGYVTGEQARRAEYLAGAIEEKFHSAEEGRYAEFTQEVAEKGILSQEIASKVRGLYRQGPGGQYQR